MIFFLTVWYQYNFRIKFNRCKQLISLPNQRVYLSAYISERGRFSGLLIGLLCCLLVACENDLAEVNKLIKEEEVAVEVGEEVEVIYSDSGNVEMKIVAPVLYRYLDKRSPKREFPEGLEVYFLDKEKKVQSWLTGSYAIEDENSQVITVQDTVILINVNQEKLETDELVWDQRSNRIYTNQFVRITTKDEKITGYGFEADREFKYWRILAPQGSVKVDPDKLEN